MIKKEKIKGLGGWLILFQIGLWGNIIVSIYLFVRDLSLQIFGYFFSFFSLFLFAYTCYSIFLMFKKSKNFPLIARVGLWLPFISNIVTLFYLGKHAGSLQVGMFLIGTMFYIIPAVLWTWYLNVSKRVKNTFVK